MNADKENAANQKGQCGSLTDRSGRISKEHGQQIHLLSCFCCGERCRTGYGIHEVCGCRGSEVGHMTREGNQKEASSCKRRVHNVLAKTAEKLFYDENCKHTADHRHPKRRLHRHVHGQQKAGYQCTAVGNRHRFLHSFFIQIFRQGTDCHRNRNQKQCPKAEIPDSHAGCRGKGKQDGKHDFVCRHLGPRVWGR